MGNRTTFEGGNGPGDANGGFRPNIVAGEEPEFGATPVAGEEPTFIGRGGAGGAGSFDNPLVRRFQAVADYAALIESETTRLRADLYDSGVAAGFLATWVALLESGATALVDQATIASEAESLSTFFTAT
jgi:hypothetical protein